MMPIGKLASVVVRNTIRSPRHFVLSAFGIVIGIASFVFFLGLSMGVRNVVLGKLFPVEEVAVVAPRASIVGVDLTKKLDDGIVQQIRDHDGVKEAVPRMNLVFPASGFGTFDGQELKFEVGGFADGIDPAFITEGTSGGEGTLEQKIKNLFRDWETEEEGKRVACLPPPPPKPKPQPKPEDIAPPPASPALDGGVAAAAAPAAPAPAAGAPAAAPEPGLTAPAADVAGDDDDDDDDDDDEPAAVPTGVCADSERYYCDGRDNMCHHRVPVLVSPTLLELYNGQFAASHGLPPISELESFMVQRGGLSRMRFTIGLGETIVAGSNAAIDAKRRRVVEGFLVGIHPKATRIGITMPIQYVQRWNREFAGDEAATSYSSIMVTLDDKDQIAPFASWVQTDLQLRLEDSLGERFATAIFIVTILFLLISLVIVSISAVNIAHNFFMQVSERRREIGVLRAVGATRADVRLIILGEAALIGVIGGILGVSIALLAAAGADWALANLAPQFPFKPETLFDFRWWIIVGGLVFSTVFCVLGGYLPARRAAGMEPAAALAAQ